MVLYGLNVDPSWPIKVQFLGHLETNIVAKSGLDKSQLVSSNDIILVSLDFLL